MTRQEHARQDAAEMASILQTAKCMARYDKVSHELLSELLVAIVTGGEVVGGNNLGSDVLSPTYGPIEVKSRILGTDGPFPRVSLKQHNLDKASWFAGMRWNKDFTLHDAIMLPKERVLELYAAKRQGGGVAHISWRDWQHTVGALSIRHECIAALGSVQQT